MQIMGPYLLVERLHSSQHAHFFKAHSAAFGAHGRDVYVRRMLPLATMEPGFGDAFVSYSHGLYQVKNRWVFSLLDFGIHEGHWFQSFKPFKGVCLSEVLKPSDRVTSKTFDAAQAASVFREYAEAVFFLYEKKLLWGIVQPSDVWLGADGVCVVPPVLHTAHAWDSFLIASLESVLGVLPVPSEWANDIRAVFTGEDTSLKTLLQAWDLACAAWGITAQAWVGDADLEKPADVRISLKETLAHMDAEKHPEVAQALERYVAEPSLLNMHWVGKKAQEQGHTALAASVYKQVSARYAQRGLLAQALWASRGLRAVGDEETFKKHVYTLADCVGLSDNALLQASFLNNQPYDAVVLQTMHATLSPTVLFDLESPFLSHLDKEGLWHIASEAPLEHAPKDAVLISKGSRFTSMYLVVSGWVVVKTPHGTSSLTVGCFGPGECVGENGYFADEARTADVVALGDTELFVLSKSLVDTVTQSLPLARRALLQFYKKRVAHAVLSQSPIFGWFSPEAREAIVKSSHIRVFTLGETLIKEGVVSKNMYLVKSGTAEVYTEGHQVIAHVASGDFVGDISALKNIPATATVETLGTLEALEIPGSVLQELLKNEVSIQDKISQEQLKRTRNNLNTFFGRQ
jgi:CRP-like cAMP-binding protein